MSVYRVFALIGVVLAPIMLIVKIVALAQYSRIQTQGDPTEGVIVSILNCILLIYFGSCINSLYLQIKEEKLPVTSGQVQRPQVQKV